MDAYVRGTALKDLTTSREMYLNQPQLTEKCYMSAHQCQTVPREPDKCVYGCVDRCHLSKEIRETPEWIARDKELRAKGIYSHLSAEEAVQAQDYDRRKKIGDFGGDYSYPTVTTCPPVPKGAYGPNRGGDGFKTNEVTGNSCFDSVTSFHSAADNLTPPPVNPDKYDVIWPTGRSVSKSTLRTEYTKVIAKAEHDLKQCDLEIDKLSKYRKSIIKALRDLQRVQKDNNRSGR